MNQPNQLTLKTLQVLVHLQYTRNSKAQVIQEVIDDLMSQSEEVVLAIGDIGDHTIVLKLPEAHVLYTLAVYRQNPLDGIRLFRRKFVNEITDAKRRYDVEGNVIQYAKTALERLDQSC